MITNIKQAQEFLESVINKLRELDEPEIVNELEKVNISLDSIQEKILEKFD